jgi:hypothetical protein
MAASNAIPELRRYRRRSITEWELAPLDILLDESKGTPRRGLILNLSEGGMAVQPFRPVARGMGGRLIFGIPRRTQRFDSEGEVAWQEPDGRAGFRFLHSPRKSRSELREWVSDVPDEARAQAIYDQAAPSGNQKTGGLEAVLPLIAARARWIGDAAGAAIALGDRSGMQCRTATGAAPPVGTSVLPDTGLSGYCLRSGEIVHCNDIWSDPRGNPATARQSETRSVVIVPTFLGGELAALLEVFSASPNAFRESHVERLKVLAQLLGAAMEESRMSNGSEVGEVSDVWNPIHASETSNSSVAPRTFQAARNIGGWARALQPSVLFPAIRSRVTFSARSAIAAITTLCLVAMLLYAVHVRNRPLTAPEAAPPETSSVPKPVTAAAARPEIGFARPRIVEKAGSTFTVDVVLKNVENVSSVPAQISYDPKQLLLVSVAEGGLLSQDHQPVALVHREDPAGGQIHVDASRPPMAPGISGTGNVFTLVFLAKAPGRSSLAIQPALRDSAMHTIPAEGSQVSVNIKE